MVLIRGEMKLEQWQINELAFNNHLFKNKDYFGLVSVGQCECWGKTEDGIYQFFEIKTQEPFEPPPFWGHGLSRWQIDKYIQMQFDLGVIWNLIIFDLINFHGYKQRLSVLEDGRFKDTHGNKPRRIYPIESYDIWIDDWRRIAKCLKEISVPNDVLLKAT